MNLQEKIIVETALEVLTINLRAPGLAARDPETVKQLIRLALESEEREGYFGVFLNSQLCVLSAERLFCRLAVKPNLYPREIAKRALELHADAVIVAHNHPSGDPTPSAEDHAMTTALSNALRLFEIRLIDHFVVGSGQMMSLMGEGLLQSNQRSKSKKLGKQHGRSRRIRRHAQNSAGMPAGLL